MCKVAIMTDSNSGITQAEAKQIGIEVVPMPFMISGEEYFEDINLTQEQFYNKLIKEDANVCTSQPSIGYVSSVWENLLKEYDEILYIPMSSGLSMSMLTAKTLAQTHYNGKVFVVDNKQISVTQKRSVFDAIELAKKGLSALEILHILEDNALNSNIYIAVDTLKFLKKGGRITPTVAMLGTIAKIKPILQIHGDKLDKFKQTRLFDKAKQIMLEKAEEDIQNMLGENGTLDDLFIDVAYTYNRDQALDFVEEIKNKFNIQDVYCDPLSLSVSCHIGPNALAIAITKKIVIKAD